MFSIIDAGFTNEKNKFLEEAKNMTRREMIIRGRAVCLVLLEMVIHRKISSHDIALTD